MSVCSKCGTTVPEEAKFCPVCGSPVAPAPLEEPAVEAPVQEETTPAQEAPAGSWYQSSESSQQTQTPPAAQRIRRSHAHPEDRPSCQDE